MTAPDQHSVTDIASSMTVADALAMEDIEAADYAWLATTAATRLCRARFDVFGLTDCRPVFVHFETPRFSEAAFAASLIELPTGVARSVRKRQAEYFFGRVAARLALREHTAPYSVIGSGPMREPLWPTGIVGSITHKRNQAAAVAMDSKRCIGIGIDLEMPLSDHAVAAVIHVALNEREARLLHECRVGIEPASAFAIAFSAKESFYKAAFGEVQRFLDFSAAMVEALDPERRVLSLRLREHLSAPLQADRLIDVHYALLADGSVLTGFHY